MKPTICSKKRSIPSFLLRNIFFIFIIIYVGLQGIAQASLMVTPTRIVFEGRVRTQEVSLIHRGDKETTYRISFQHMRMKPDGSYEEIQEPKPNEQFADEFIRYSPRQVTLKPGQSQTIRLMARKPKNLPAGEYRSHMLFKEIAPPDLGFNIEREKGKPEDIAVQTIALFGVSIPVIVRHGNLSANIKIQEAKVTTGENFNGKENLPILSLNLTRSGNSSVYGDICVTYTPENTSKQCEIGRLLGIAVFCPNDTRHISIPLKIPEGVPLEKGTIHIVYRKCKAEGGDILAERRLLLSQNIFSD
ncbi:MAG: molecular chaperone [bacterium]